MSKMSNSEKYSSVLLLRKQRDGVIDAVEEQIGKKELMD